MNLKKLIFPLLFCAIFFQKSTASEFEGSITLTKETLYDTVFFQFSVLKNMIRLDQKNSHKEIIQSLIIDLNTEKITALSPNHKLYTNIQKKSSSAKKLSDIKVIATENFKIINGYKCFLWRVRNETKKNEASFWVYNSGYSFFQKAVQLLSCTEDYADLFGDFDQIETNGSLPILSIERTLLREEKAKIMVTKISPTKISSHLFEIPEGYKYLRY